MSYLNKAMIIGNLGSDPELRYTQNQNPVCSLSVATTENWTDNQGNKQEKTQWHKVVVWGRSAENCAKYLTKGSSVYVEGRIETRSYDNAKNGVKMYVTEIIADTVKFMSKGRGAQAGASEASQQQGEVAEAEAGYGEGFSGGLDDIPF